ncbi:protein kinase domain-containing protein [Nocardia sp. BMG111209]|uniref:protein kinase domain-containing protein n=1 Tax=Nocardia sp. BMG111209 TaxID=1160137 RepID=UPI000377AB88|nr:protein kinase [Nocardia sp. BMG111209]
MTEPNSATTRLDGPRAHAPAGPPPTRIDAPGVAAPEAEFRRENLPPGLAARLSMGVELGRGAEASVYRCRDAEGNEFAVKLFRNAPRYATDFGSAEYREHFRPEYAVQVTERGVDHEVHYEVMEYCRFGTLDALLHRNGGFGDHAAAVEVLWQVATALHGMQRAGNARVLVHGDVKPSNILVRAERPLDLVLSDFGLSVDLGDRSKLTNFGAVTAAYCAPGATQYVTPEADWWSVGMVMFHVLAGRAYFQRDDEDGGFIDERTVEHELTVRDVSLAALDSVELAGADRERWKLLLAGLLTRDPRRRWGMAEVSAWHDGGSPPVHRATADEAAGADVPPHRHRASIPHPLPGVGQFFRADELGAAMAAHPEAAARALAGRGLQQLLSWLTHEAEFEAAFTDLRSYGAEWGPDELASYFVAQLAPDAPVGYRGRPVGTHAELRMLALDAAAADDARELFRTNLLGCLAGPDRTEHKLVDANWHDIESQARAMADARAIVLDDAARAHIIRFALLLAASDDAFVDDYLRTVRRDVAAAVAAHADEIEWFATLRRDVDA